MTTELMRKPDSAQIQREVKRLETTWYDAHTEMAKLDEVYFGQNNIWAVWERDHPGGKGKRPNHHSMRGRAIIDHATDALLAIRPTFHREPVGDSKEHHKRADAVENGLRAVIADAFAWSPQVPPKVNGKQLLRHNYTQIHVGMDFESLRRPRRRGGESQENFERREFVWSGQRMTWNPIRIDVPAPGTVLMDPIRSIPNLVIARKKMRQYELADLTRTKVRKWGREGQVYKIKGDAEDEVEVIERWTPWTVTLMEKGGQILFIEDNHWGFVPYAQSFGGDVDTPTGEAFNPAWWIKQSMLFSVMPTLEMIDQAYVAHQTLIQRTAWARMGTELNAADLADQAQGDILSGKETDIWIEKTPSLAGDSHQHLQELKQSVEENTFSMQAVGFRQAGVATATESMILSEATNRIFADTKVQLENIWSIAASYTLRLVHKGSEHYEDFMSINVGGASLKAKDIEGHFHVQAKFEVIDVATAIQEKADARADRVNGDIDWRTYLKKARYEDVASIEKGLRADSIRNDPQILELNKVVAYREAGYPDLATALEEAIRQRKLTPPAAAGLLGPNGQPLSARVPGTNGTVGVGA